MDVMFLTTAQHEFTFIEMNDFIAQHNIQFNGRTEIKTNNQRLDLFFEGGVNTYKFKNGKLEFFMFNKYLGQ